MATAAQIAKSTVTAFRESARRVLLRNKEKLRGAIVGSMRTKTIPEQPNQSSETQDTEIVHVVDVRLLDSPDQTIVRDVLLATQARQLISGGSIPVLSLSDLESGTPVELAYDALGNLQIIGRLASTTAVLAVDTYELGDFELPYTWGLEAIRFSELSGTIQTQINADRTAAGLVALDPVKEFQSMSDAEIADLFGIVIADYNATRAAMVPPLAPVTAQEAVNLERNKRGQASIPDTFLAMNLFIYVDYFSAVTIGSPTYGVPGLGRFGTTTPVYRNRAQTKTLTLYGSPDFVYGVTNYGHAIYTYVTP